MSNLGWECPKCGACWAPAVEGRKACRQIDVPPASKLSLSEIPSEPSYSPHDKRPSYIFINENCELVYRGPDGKETVIRALDEGYPDRWPEPNTVVRLRGTNATAIVMSVSKEHLGIYRVNLREPDSLSTYFSRVISPQSFWIFYEPVTEEKYRVKRTDLRVWPEAGGLIRSFLSKKIATVTKVEPPAGDIPGRVYYDYVNDEDCIEQFYWPAESPIDFWKDWEAVEEVKP